MKRFRRLGLEARYRSARSTAWINGVGTAAFVVVAVVAKVRKLPGGMVGPMIFAALWLCLTGVAVWRMRRARRAARVVELFSTHA